MPLLCALPHFWSTRCHTDLYKLYVNGRPPRQGFSSIDHTTVYTLNTSRHRDFMFLVSRPYSSCCLYDDQTMDALNFNCTKKTFFFDYLFLVRSSRTNYCSKNKNVKNAMFEYVVRSFSPHHAGLSFVVFLRLLEKHHESRETCPSTFIYIQSLIPNYTKESCLDCHGEEEVEFRRSGTNCSRVIPRTSEEERHDRCFGSVRCRLSANRELS